MDARSEDTIVRQIEKNLSEHMDDNLFLTGRAVDTNKPVPRSKASLQKVTDQPREDNKDYPLVSFDNINNAPSISRAEYIRQAREACLRQLSNTQIYSRAYDVNYIESDPLQEDQLNQKKARVMKLFPNNREEGMDYEDRTSKSYLSYRSIIIRCVCCIVLFLSVFLLDKFQVTLGDFSHTTIKEYVTGNDALKQLENLLVTWLK